MSIHLVLIARSNCLLHITTLRSETEFLHSYSCLTVQNSILGLRVHCMLQTYPQWLVQKAHQKSGAKPSTKTRSAKICWSIHITRPLFFSKDCQKIETVFQMFDNCCIRGYHTALCNTFVPSISIRERKVFTNSAHCTCNTDLRSAASKVTSRGGILEWQGSARSRDWGIRLRPR